MSGDELGSHHDNEGSGINHGDGENEGPDDHGLIHWNEAPDDHGHDDHLNPTTIEEEALVEAGGPGDDSRTAGSAAFISALGPSGAAAVPVAVESLHRPRLRHGRRSSRLDDR